MAGSCAVASPGWYRASPVSGPGLGALDRGNATYGGPGATVTVSKTVTVTG
jgi:hypothetical protein